MIEIVGISIYARYRGLDRATFLDQRLHIRHDWVWTNKSNENLNDATKAKLMQQDEPDQAGSPNHKVTQRHGNTY